MFDARGFNDGAESEARLSSVFLWPMFDIDGVISTVRRAQTRNSLFRIPTGQFEVLQIFNSCGCEREFARDRIEELQVTQKLDVLHTVAWPENVGGKATAVSDSSKERDLLGRQRCCQGDLLRMAFRRVLRQPNGRGALERPTRSVDFHGPAASACAAFRRTH